MADYFGRTVEDEPVSPAPDLSGAIRDSVNREGTVANLASRYDRDTLDLATLAMANREKAREQLLSMERRIEVNRGSLSTLADEGTRLASHGVPLTNSERIASLGAQDMVRFKHRSHEITVDGQKTTIGAYLLSDDTWSASQKSELERRGFLDPNVHKYFTGPASPAYTAEERQKGTFQSDAEAARAIMSLVVKPSFNYSDAMSDPLREQRHALASYVGANMKGLLADLGPDGASALVKGAMDEHLGTGGATHYIDAVYKLVRKTGGTSDSASSAERVASTLATLKDITDNAFAIPGSAVQMTPAEKRWAVKAVVDAVSASDANLDFSDERTRAGFRLAASAYARARASNFDLFTDTAAGGRGAQKDLGKFISHYGATGEMPENNLITVSLRRRDRLNQRITGGSDTEFLPAVRSGSRSAYENNRSAVIGSESSNMSADLTAFHLINSTDAVLSAYAGSSINEDVAIRTIMSDKGRRAEFAGKIDDAISRGTGIRDVDAVAAIRERYFKFLQSDPSGRFNVEDEISRMANDWRYGTPGKKDLRPTFARWVIANVKADRQFSELSRRLKAHLMSKYVGLNESMADAEVARIRMETVQRAQNPGPGTGPVLGLFNSALTKGTWFEMTGRYVDPATGKVGKMTKQNVPVGTYPEVVPRSGDMRSAVRWSFTPDAGWKSAQADYTSGDFSAEQDHLARLYAANQKMEAVVSSKVAKDRAASGDDLSD